MSITSLLAERILRAVDAPSRERAVLHVLDWIGCAVIGATTEPGRILAGWARDEGTGPCRLIFGDRGSLWTAALLNGAVGNVLEMDDIHRTAILHPGPVVIPAALAMAERERATSIALLDAVVRGYEAMIRVGQAVGPAHYRFWHNTSTCGPFGAAAAGASLLGLDTSGLTHALGNAGTQAAGLWQVRHEPVMSKQLHNGRAAHAGLLAADWARRGFTGPASILEGPQGFFAAMCSDADPAVVLADPDAPWKIHETGFKPWPARRHAHAAIDAALALRPRLAPDSITRIEVRTYPDAIAFCDRVHPETIVQAKFSLQHSVAMSLLAGDPQLEHFEPMAIQAPRVAALRERVRLEAAEPYAWAYPRHFGAEVVVHVTDGTMHRHAVSDALGDTENPLAREAIIGKARTLMRAAGMSPPATERLIDATLALAAGGPVRALTDALRSTS